MFRIRVTDLSIVSSDILPSFTCLATPSMYSSSLSILSGPTISTGSRRMSTSALIARVAASMRSKLSWIAAITIESVITTPS